MYGESNTPSARPPKHERMTLTELFERDKNEPSAAEIVMKAADVMRLEIDGAENRAAKAEAELSAAEAELSIDPDTGLWTEKKFNQEVNAWIHLEGGSLDTQIAIVFIDMNNLKLVNDTLGHAAGDEAIRELAIKLKDIADSGLRIDDFRGVSRSNKQGDEFILALPAREADGIREGEDSDDIRKALRDKINALILAGHDNNHYASGCIITTRGELLENGLDFYKNLADEQMYKNKQRMRDQAQLEDDEHAGTVGIHHI